MKINMIIQKLKSNSTTYHINKKKNYTKSGHFNKKICGRTQGKVSLHEKTKQIPELMAEMQ